MQRTDRSILGASGARVAGQIATVGLLLAICLQVLLAFGILPITMAWGGSQPILTLPLRFAGVAAAAILGGFTYVIRRRAGLIAGVRPSPMIKLLAWAITFYLALNTLGNFASASQAESMIFGPLSLISALACLVVSASRTDE